MKHIRKASIPLARRRTAIAAADYSQFTNDELIAEAMGLHATLATAGNFGRVAELGLRHVIVDRLLQIDEEHTRRQTLTKPALARSTALFAHQQPDDAPRAAA